MVNVGCEIGYSMEERNRVGKCVSMDRLCYHML